MEIWRNRHKALQSKKSTGSSKRRIPIGQVKYLAKVVLRAVFFFKAVRNKLFLQYFYNNNGLNYFL